MRPRKAVDGAAVEVLAVQSLEVEVLILQGVGELVRERHLEPDGHGGAPDLHPLVDGVVEGQGARVGHLVVGSEQVEGAGRDAEGPQLAGVALELDPVLVREPALLARRLLRVVGRAEEVDVHGVVEAQPARLLDEGHDVGHPRIPGVGVRGPVVDRPGERGGHPEHEEPGDDGAEGGGGAVVHATGRSDGGRDAGHVLRDEVLGRREVDRLVTGDAGGGMGKDRDQGGDQVPGQEGRGGAVDAVVRHEDQGGTEDAHGQRHRHRHRRSRPVQHPRLGEVDGRDGPRDGRGDEQSAARPPRPGSRSP